MSYKGAQCQGLAHTLLYTPRLDRDEGLYCIGQPWSRRTRIIPHKHQEIISLLTNCVTQVAHYIQARPAKRRKVLHEWDISSSRINLNDTHANRHWSRLASSGKGLQPPAIEPGLQDPDDYASTLQHAMQEGPHKNKMDDSISPGQVQTDGPQDKPQDKPNLSLPEHWNHHLDRVRNTVKRRHIQR